MKYGSGRRVRSSSPTGWLHMRDWRMSLRRMKSAVISCAGSFVKLVFLNSINIYNNFLPHPLSFSWTHNTQAPLMNLFANHSIYFIWRYEWLGVDSLGLVEYAVALKWASSWHFSSSVNFFFKRTCAAILPYFMCANREGSGETARMRRLAWAFAGRLCDKYHNLMSWLK